jgi:hypothetical protein
MKCFSLAVVGSILEGTGLTEYSVVAEGVSSGVTVSLARRRCPWMALFIAAFVW